MATYHLRIQEQRPYILFADPITDEVSTSYLIMLGLQADLHELDNKGSQ
jgi:hypothetical protein